MIANYGFRPFSEKDLWNWLDNHMTGPFAYEGSTTAHWEEHIQVSNEVDRALLLERIPDAKLYTEGHSGFEKKPTPERFLTAEQFIQKGQYRWNLRIYFGKNVTGLGEFLKEHPVPIMPASEMASATQRELDFQRMMKGRNKLWDMLTGEHTYKVVLNDALDSDAKDWLAQNIKLGFSYYCLPNRIGLFDITNENAVAVVLFADKAEAAKFKLFYG